MFSFEAEPHDDGMSVRAAAENLKGQVVKMSMPTRGKMRGDSVERVRIVDVYPAFFTIHHVDHIRDSYVECVAYRDVTAGLFVSNELDREIHRIEATRPEKRPRRDSTII